MGDVPGAASRQLEMDGRVVEYRLRRSPAAKRLRIRIGPAGITVTLPGGREESEVEPFLRQNAEWIRHQLDRVETIRRLRRPETIRRDTVLYRGEATPVQVEESPYRLGPARVTCAAGGIVIARAPDSSVPPRRSLVNWLRKQARATIEAELAAVTGRLNVIPNRVYIMEQRTKWGNCSARGNLSFNWRIIQAPPFVLRYLVTHEAVHLAVPDHSRKFWLTVQSICPETERARQWLSAHAHQLQAELTIQ